MPIPDPDKDYVVVDEATSDAGFKSVTVAISDEDAPVEVHVYGAWTDDDELVRLRGCMLGGPPSNENLDATMNVPMDIVNEEPFYVEEVEVRADGPVDDVTYEER